MKIIKDDVDRLMDWVRTDYIECVDHEEFIQHDEKLEKKIRALIKKQITNRYFKTPDSCVGKPKCKHWCGLC